MAYVNPNYKYKKELIAAVRDGLRVTVYSPGPFGCNMNGQEVIEGPHYPRPHTWYAQVTVKNGRVIKVL